MVSHPYSIYIWQPSRTASGQPVWWFEPVKADTQQYALYIANLIHRDSQAIIKVDGDVIACFPDAHAVELVERQIVQQKKTQLEEDG